MPQKPQKSELGSSELHQTVRGGERVLIRRARQRKRGVRPGRKPQTGKPTIGLMSGPTNGCLKASKRLVGKIIQLKIHRRKTEPS